MNTSSTTTYMLGLANQDETVEFDVSAYDYGTVSVSIRTGAWGGGVVTIERTLNGDVWQDLKPDPLTFSADDISWRIDLQGTPTIRAKVTTSVGVGFPVVDVSFYGVDSE